MQKALGLKILLLTLSALLLTGCGQQETAGNSEISNGADKTTVGAEQSTPGEDWRVQFAEIGLGKDGRYTEFARTEGMLYAITAVMNQEDEYKLPYLTDEKLWKTGTKQYFDTQPIAMTAGHQPRCLASDGKETLYLLAQDYSTTPSSYFLYTKDADGEVQQLDITEGCQEALGSEDYVTTIAVDAAGRIYLGAFLGQDKLLVLEADGSKAAVIDLQDVNVYDMAAVDGKVYCVGMTQEADGLFLVNDSTWQLDNLTELPESQGTLMLSRGAEGSLLFGYYGGIYEFNVESKEGREIYIWTNAGLTGRDVSDFWADERGNICVIPKDQRSESGMELILLRNPAAASSQGEEESATPAENVTANQGTKVSTQDKNVDEASGFESAPASQDPGVTGQNASEPAVREEIVIAGSCTDSELTKAVSKFNVRNDKYKVVIKSYNYDLLMTEIITGNGPDLFPVSDIGTEVCAHMGVAEDLYPYLEESEVLSADMLHEKVLELATVDGKLLSIPPSFGIDTLWGRKSELGDEPGWTTEEFLDYVEQNRGKTIIEGYLVGDSRINIVYMMWLARQEQWIDWEQGKAFFDSEEFRELLEFAVDYKSEYDEEYNAPNRDSTETRWQDGKILLYASAITHMSRYRWDKQFLGEDIVAIGYPTEEGSPCHMINFPEAYAINSMSEHKEGAWAFIEFLVSSDFGHYIPTLKSKMEVMLEESMVGSKIFKAATEEDVALIRELIDNAILSEERSRVINRILTEELQTCIFQGRSVDETVDIIQNRVQLYLDEM